MNGHHEPHLDQHTHLAILGAYLTSIATNQTADNVRAAPTNTYEQTDIAHELQNTAPDLNAPQHTHTHEQAQQDPTALHHTPTHTQPPT